MIRPQCVLIYHPRTITPILTCSYSSQWEKNTGWEVENWISWDAATHEPLSLSLSLLYQVRRLAVVWEFPAGTPQKREGAGRGGGAYQGGLWAAREVILHSRPRASVSGFTEEKGSCLTADAALPPAPAPGFCGFTVQAGGPVRPRGAVLTPSLCNRTLGKGAVTPCEWHSFYVPGCPWREARPWDEKDGFRVERGGPGGREHVSSHAACVAAATVPRLLNVEGKAGGVLPARASGHARPGPRQEAARGRCLHQADWARGSLMQR